MIISVDTNKDSPEEIAQIIEMLKAYLEPREETAQTTERENQDLPSQESIQEEPTSNFMGMFGGMTTASQAKDPAAPSAEAAPDLQNSPSYENFQQLIELAAQKRQETEKKPDLGPKIEIF